MVCDKQVLEALSLHQTRSRLTETQSYIWFRAKIPTCSRCQPSCAWSRSGTEVTLYVPNTVYNKVASAGLAGRTAGAKLTVTNANMKLAVTPLVQPEETKKDGPYCAALQTLVPQMIALSSRPLGINVSCVACLRRSTEVELVSYGWEMLTLGFLNPAGSRPMPKRRIPLNPFDEDLTRQDPPPGEVTQVWNNSWQTPLGAHTVRSMGTGDTGVASTPPPSTESPSSDPVQLPEPSTTPEAPQSSAAPEEVGTLAAAIAPDSPEQEESDTPPPLVSDPRELHSTDSPPNGTAVPVGMRILPGLADKKYYSNIRRNVEDAIEGRITSKKVEFTATYKERQEITRMVEALKTEAFGEKKIREVVGTVLFEDLKSKKWTADRVKNAIQQLHEKYSPGMQFTCSIKLEPMPSGKPPRLLIADGDCGQVKSWLVIGVLERLLFAHFGDNSIKQGSKVEAMELHEEHMRIKTKQVAIMENDGSAWDACCRKPLRELIEVPIIEHIIKVIDQMVIPENEWSIHRVKADKLTTLKLRFQPKIRLTDPEPDVTQEEIEHSAMNKPIFFKIDAIRRSGDRGTSCLNFLTNFVCWAWVLCGGASCCLMVKGRVRGVPLYNGAQSTVKIKCEGDDSHVMTTYKFTKEEYTDMHDRWVRLGHRPKLYLRKPGSVTEFTGYHFLVDEHGIVPASGCPDVARTMIGSASTMSKNAVQSATGDIDEKEFATIASATLLCAAASFSKRLPTLAEFYLRNSREYMTRAGVKHHELTHDQMMRLCPEVKEDIFPERWKQKESTEKILTVGSKIGDIVHQVECAISQADLELESQHVADKGVCSAEEWKELMALHMNVGPDTDLNVYRQALRDTLQPTAVRKKQIFWNKAVSTATSSQP